MRASLRIHKPIAAALLFTALSGCGRAPRVESPPEPEHPWRVLIANFSAPANLPRLRTKSANACFDGCLSGSIGGGSVALGAQAADPSVAAGCLLASCLFASAKFLFAGPEITSESSPYTRVYVEAIRGEIAEVLTSSKRLDGQADPRLSAPPETIAGWTALKRAEYMRERKADALVAGEVVYMEEVVDPGPGESRCFLRARVKFQVFSRSGEPFFTRLAEGETHPRLPVESLGTDEIARAAGRPIGEQLLSRFLELTKP